MPYKSEKQRRFFEACRHNPKHMRGKCPKESVLEEFHSESAKQKDAMKRSMEK